MERLFWDVVAMLLAFPDEHRQLLALGLCLLVTVLLVKFGAVPRFSWRVPAVKITPRTPEQEAADNQRIVDIRTATRNIREQFTDDGDGERQRPILHPIVVFERERDALLGTQCRIRLEKLAARAAAELVVSRPAPVSPVEPEPPTNPPCVRCGHALSAHRPEFGACDGRERPCACPEYQVPTVEPEPCVWRPIETAPEGEYVILWVPNAGWMRGIRTREIWWNGEEIINRPTHWQPQPAAPLVVEPQTGEEPK